MSTIHKLLKDKDHDLQYHYETIDLEAYVDVTNLLAKYGWTLEDWEESCVGSYILPTFGKSLCRPIKDAPNALHVTKDGRSLVLLPIVLPLTIAMNPSNMDALRKVCNDRRSCEVIADTLIPIIEFEQELIGLMKESRASISPSERQKVKQKLHEMCEKYGVDPYDTSEDELEKA